jgi:quercetin dioxygenase-like cupin family protein
MHVIHGAGAQPERATRDIFTGEVHIHTFVDDKIGQRLRMTLVRFSPGGRTKWHRHAFEQGLIITEGRGIVATEDQENVVTPGDYVIVPEGEKHWHGATEDTAMAHISITMPGETTVLEPVERVMSR